MNSLADLHLIAMAAPAGGASPLWQFLPFALILAIFYFLILQPMKRRQRKIQDFQGSLKVGDATKRDTVVGPLVSETQRDRVEAMIRRGVDEGGTLAAGGTRPDVPGYAVAPSKVAKPRQSASL